MRRDKFAGLTAIRIIILSYKIANALTPSDVSFAKETRIIRKTANRHAHLENEDGETFSLNHPPTYPSEYYAHLLYPLLSFITILLPARSRFSPGHVFRLTSLQAG